MNMSWLESENWTAPTQIWQQSNHLWSDSSLVLMKHGGQGWKWVSKEVNIESAIVHQNWRKFRVCSQRILAWFFDVLNVTCQFSSTKLLEIGQRKDHLPGFDHFDFGRCSHKSWYYLNRYLLIIWECSLADR